MIYVATVRLDEDGRAVAGKGPTEAEALENCLAQIRKKADFGVELAEGVVLPKAIAAKVPANLPDGSSLLILERCSHSDGGPYDWRFFAIKYGTQLLRRDGFPKSRRMVGSSPVMHSFLDCNADYEYKLPEGSMEFVDGGWVPCRVAQYSY